MAEGTIQDTICAIATPGGNAGVGIVRVSGPLAFSIAEKITKKQLQPRLATYSKFFNNSEIIDYGVAIYFKSPNSFTGEDVVEFQGHGGQIVLNNVLSACLDINKESCSPIRMAKPGEFSERAFLNDKMDLAQAEAVASLIHASSDAQAKAAINSLSGEFSNKITAMVERVINIRLFIEATLDFPDEDIDFIKDNNILEKLNDIIKALDCILKNAKTGAVLSDGITAVLMGRANAGKSSVLNRLTKEDTAIVTDIAGTTRDVIKTKVNLDNLSLNILDTAGIRETGDLIEQEGIKRTVAAIKTADIVLLVIDYSESQEINPQILFPDYFEKLKQYKIIVIANKIDVVNMEPCIKTEKGIATVFLSAKENVGFEKLAQLIKKSLGISDTLDSVYAARKRHVNLLSCAQERLNKARKSLERGETIELVAEELKCCQDSLSEITGEFSSDDLLGKIFSEFCIGK